MPPRVIIIYSSQYLNYSFGKGHPFWPERAAQFLSEIATSQLADFNWQIIKPKKASDKDILLVHTPDYLERVKQLAREGGQLAIDTPVSEKNLEAAYYYTGGTILASQLVLEGKTVFNTLGGLHHAESGNSSGFCIFNDHAIAIRKLQKQGKIKRAAILDIDVHAGNGTQEIFYRDPTVLNISIHQDPATLYPGTGFPWQIGEGKGRGYTVNICLPPGTTEKDYLTALDKILPKIKDFNPDITFIIFGVDTFKQDSLASIKLEEGSYKKIGARVAKLKKVVTLCAGGYSRQVPKLWLSYLRGYLTALRS